MEVYADRTCQVCTAIAASVFKAGAASVHKASLVVHCSTGCCMPWMAEGPQPGIIDVLLHATQ